MTKFLYGFVWRTRGRDIGVTRASEGGRQEKWWMAPRGSTGKKILDSEEMEMMNIEFGKVNEADPFGSLAGRDYHGLVGSSLPSLSWRYSVRRDPVDANTGLVSYTMIDAIGNAIGVAGQSVDGSDYLYGNMHTRKGAYLRPEFFVTQEKQTCLG